MHKIETKHPIIDKILIKIEPLIDERTARYVENYNTTRDKNNVLYEAQRAQYQKTPNSYYNVPRGETRYTYTGELKQWMIEDYEYALVSDFIRALARYIKTTDSLISFEVTNAVPVTLSGEIEREGQRFTFDTDIIPAGGYNIQRFHYRYITKTELPSMEESAAKWINNLGKLKVLEENMKELLRRQAKLVTDIKSKSELTEDQIWEESQYSSWDYTWREGETRGAKSQEEMDERKLRYREEEVQRHNTQLNFLKRDLKEIPKMIAKLEEKIAKIKSELK